jgi:hypothetical protein
LEPSVAGGDDGCGVRAPDEGLGALVVLVDEAVDGGLEIDDRAEDAVLQPTAGELGKEALDGVQPGAGGGREVEGPAWMSLQPGADLGVLVRRVVVEDALCEASNGLVRFG